MMIVLSPELQRVHDFYVNLVNQVGDADLESDEIIGVFTKVLTLLCIAKGLSHDEVLERMSYVYQFETYFQPDKEDIH